MKFILIITMCLLSIVNIATANERVKYSGTFSTFYYNEEGGDLLGTELRIVFTSNGYQGTIQIAEGTPSKLMFITPVFKERNISFLIDDESYKGRFEGKYTELGIEGKISYEGGGESVERLPRKAGYWDTVRYAHKSSSAFIASWKDNHFKTSDQYSTKHIKSLKTDYRHDKKFMRDYELAVKSLVIPDNIKNKIGEILWIHNSNAFLVEPINRFKHIPNNKRVMNEHMYRQCEHDHSWLVVGEERRWIPLKLNPYCEEYDDNYGINFYYFYDISNPIIETVENGPACTTFRLHSWSNEIKKYKEIEHKCE